MHRTSLVIVFLFYGAFLFAGKGSQEIKSIEPLLTVEEKQALAHVKTDKDREQFLRDFWSRRDPTPSTPENEFKNEYEARLKYLDGKADCVMVQRKVNANSPAWADPLTRFCDGPDTDLGRTILLLGKPTEGVKNPKTLELRYSGLPKAIAEDEVTIHFRRGLRDLMSFADPEEQIEPLLARARDYWANGSKSN